MVTKITTCTRFLSSLPFDVYKHQFERWRFQGFCPENSHVILQNQLPRVSTSSAWYASVHCGQSSWESAAPLMVQKSRRSPPGMVLKPCKYIDKLPFPQLWLISEASTVSWWNQCHNTESQFYECLQCFCWVQFLGDNSIPPRGDKSWMQLQHQRHIVEVKSVPIGTVLWHQRSINKREDIHNRKNHFLWNSHHYYQLSTFN